VIEVALAADAVPTALAGGLAICCVAVAVVIISVSVAAVVVPRLRDAVGILVVVGRCRCWDRLIVAVTARYLRECCTSLCVENTGLRQMHIHLEIDDASTSR